MLVVDNPEGREEKIASTHLHNNENKGNGDCGTQCRPCCSWNVPEAMVTVNGYSILTTLIQYTKACKTQTKD